MLTMQNRVTLNNLTNIRSLRAGTLTARAWETLRAAVHGVALARAVAPTFGVTNEPGGSPVGDAGPDLTAWVGHDLPRMRPGVERC